MSMYDVFIFIFILRAAIIGGTMATHIKKCGGSPDSLTGRGRYPVYILVAAAPSRDFGPCSTFITSLV
jgi:hypothetical protein